MSLKVNVTTGGVTSESPRVSVVLASLGTTTSATIPVANIDYIELLVGVELDSSGRYRSTQSIAVVLDSVRLSVGKAAQDSVGLVDTRTIQAAKVLTDSASFTETFIRTVSYIRDLANSALLTDEKQLQIAKAVVDSFSTVDVQSLVINKAIYDGVAMNDSADLIDGITFQAVKSVMNIVFAGDITVVGVQKALSHAAQAADSGLLTNQNYCGSYYFAEDYVGISRSF